MRILQVIPSYLPAARYGGPLYSVHGLSRALASLGHDVHVFTTNVDGATVSDVPLGRPVDFDGVSVRYFSVDAPRRLYRSRTMAAALEDSIDSFDVVHLHSVFLWPTWAAARLARFRNVPYILSPRGMLVRRLVARKSALAKLAWIACIERRNVAAASAVHVTSEIEAEELRRFRFKLPRIVNIPNAVEPPDDRQGEIQADIRRAASVKPLVLSLGRISWKKNLSKLVEAMQHISGAHLIVAGYPEDGHEAQLARLVDRLGLTSRVTILARPVLGSEKELLFGCCDVFVMPSISENFGNAALEAMLRGKPVVVSNAAGVAELVALHKCGIVAEPEPGALARGVNTLLSNPASSVAMGERGAAIARQYYSWKAVAEKMADAYESVLWPHMAP